MKPYLALLIVVMACQSDPNGPGTGTDPESPGDGSEPQSFIPGVSGDYLGQGLPGTEIKRFAPGIIPFDGMYHTVTVAPDGGEIYWAQGGGIVFTRRVNDNWTTPAPVSFSGGSGEDFIDDAPVLSPDNRTLFFTSRRPFDLNPGGSWRFWSSERTAGGWSVPQPLSEVINSTGASHWQVSVAESGTIYFGAPTVTGDSVHESIYRSRLVNGVYAPPEPLSINSFGYLLCPFIAPDESYIIFNRLDPVVGWSEGFFVSFRGSNGEWLTPQKLPQFPVAQEGSFVTRDGRFLFAKGHWVSTQIIEDLRPR